MPARGGEASVTARWSVPAALLGVGLFSGCGADVEDDPNDQPRWAQSTTTVRVVTANLAQWDWANLLAENGFGANHHIYLGALQVSHLQSLESSGPTVYNLQESSVRRDLAGGIDWPTYLEDSLGFQADLPEHADYVSTYERVSPRQGHDDGTWGNALTTNLDIEDYESWDLSDGCSTSGGRVAQAARFDVGGVSVWSVNVHLEICNDDEANACNLDNLFNELDGLPSDHVVVVSGDFNITQDATESCPTQPARFYDMVDRFRERQFTREATARVDHVFLRDTAFRLAGATSRVVPRFHQTPIGVFKISDHDYIETDIDVSGPGMSPTMVPLLATF